ncbi:UvrD-helicase domain-containing protein [Hydrogenophilus thermoluteolus]|uniref:ATP-dependent DNA helicase Rep n=1 Tax=Hydrogenophilus thermoluteolus TaxID=297 RepID=A0A2Z6DVC2_HYDTE|nr:UvrD-helicase domain-containing protein [Hydrogenophilus thermoluteolus]BBD76381.1 UvrD/REP helicase [Hydrogenophilus thermoluteolus]
MRLDGLNPAQQEAVRYLDGPCLVLAGAGSGKTRVITHKIAYLIETAGFAPRHIAAITFTNKAAREMQERVSSLLGGRAPSGLTVCTFHALGVQILRAESARLALKPRFSILDPTDVRTLLAELVKEADRGWLQALQGQISQWKNQGVLPDAAEAVANDELTSQAARVYRDYERALAAYHAVDFDDLILKPLLLFERDPEAREAWQRRLRYLLVDEYQDTNRTQYRLLRALAGVRGAFTAVGDDDQAIYAWRGADVENLRLLQTDYPQLKVIKLEQNYRSTRTILNAANTLIANNDKLFVKRLWSLHGVGSPIVVRPCRDPEAEAEWVVATLDAKRFELGAKWSDFAILYRGNHQARLFEQALRAHRIPYVISGGGSFFDRTEIRDAMAYLRLLVNEDDDPAFVRAITTPRRGVGATSLEALSRYAGARHLSLFAALFETGAEAHVPAAPLAAMREFAAFLNRFRYRAEREPAGRVARELFAAVGLDDHYLTTMEPREAEQRTRSLDEFLGWIERRGEADGTDLLNIVQTITLIARLERDDETPDAVQLATLHAAKGLEFPHVFLVGVEEGLLPHQSSIDAGDIEEERRLMYVGITRAQRSLTITYCEKRRDGKEWRSVEPSRFIAEMGSDGVTVKGRDHPVPKEEAKARLAQLRALLERAPAVADE